MTSFRMHLIAAILLAHCIGSPARAVDTPAPSTAAPELSLVRAKIKAKDWRSAVVDLQKLAATHQHADIYNLLGFSLRNLGEYAEARSYYGKALDFDPQHKGIDLLVRALAIVPRDSRPRLRLVGPDWRDGRERMVALVRELDLAEWVSIEPPLYGDEKWAALRSATGFVYPSRWEGFGNSVAEAASLGLPLLVTPYPFGRLLHRRGGAVLATATVTRTPKKRLDRATIAVRSPVALVSVMRASRGFAPGPTIVQGGRCPHGVRAPP